MKKLFSSLASAREELPRLESLFERARAMLHGSANTAGSEVTADSTSVSHAASHRGGSPQSRGTNPPRSTSTHGHGRHKSRHSHRSRNSKRSHRSRRSGDSKHKGHHHHRHNHHRHRRHHRHRHEGVTKAAPRALSCQALKRFQRQLGRRLLTFQQPCQCTSSSRLWSGASSGGHQPSAGAVAARLPCVPASCAHREGVQLVLEVAP